MFACPQSSNPTTCWEVAVSVCGFYIRVDIIALWQIPLYNIIKRKGLSYEAGIEDIGTAGAVRCKSDLHSWKSAYNVVSYVIGLLLLVIGGSAIYCIVKALWQSLLILVVLGIATIAAVFLLVWAVMKVENIGESLGAFIRS